MTETHSPAAEYLRFLAWVAGVALLIALVGALPTRRLGGPGALPAMIAGCVVGALASAAGGIPVASGRKATDPAGRLNSMLFSMLLRLALVVGLGAAALAGGFERKPLLLWIGISYLALLAVDVRYAVKGF
jgi:Na+/proline symporter